MNTKHEQSNIPPSNLFVSQSGITYDIEEIVASFQQHHYLFDFKNNINSSHNRPFSEYDIHYLMQNYPKLRNVCVEHYTNHILIGLIFKQQEREELFQLLEELHLVLTDLINEYNWAWIPDEVLAIKLSAPLDALHQFVEKTRIKFIDYIVDNDSYLNLFMRGGLKDYLGKIREGGCSAGFVEAFSRIYAQALTCKCYVEFQSQKKHVANQNESSARSGFFPNVDNRPEKDTPEGSKNTL